MSGMIGAGAKALNSNGVSFEVELENKNERERQDIISATAAGSLSLITPEYKRIGSAVPIVVAAGDKLHVYNAEDYFSIGCAQPSEGCAETPAIVQEGDEKLRYRRRVTQSSGIAQQEAQQPAKLVVGENPLFTFTQCLQLAVPQAPRILQAAREQEQFFIAEPPTTTSKNKRPRLTFTPGLHICERTKTAKKTTLLCTATLKADVPTDFKPKGRNLVFGIDVSGSMANNGGLAAVKTTLKACIESTTPLDRLGVIKFDTNSTPILPPQFMTKQRKVQALEAVEALVAGGSTNIMPCIGQMDLMQLSCTREDMQRGEYRPCISIPMTDGQSGLTLLTVTNARSEAIAVGGPDAYNNTLYPIGLGSDCLEAELKYMAQGYGGKYVIANMDKVGAAVENICKVPVKGLITRPSKLTVVTTGTWKVINIWAKGQEAPLQSRERGKNKWTVNFLPLTEGQEPGVVFELEGQGPGTVQSIWKVFDLLGSVETTTSTEVISLQEKFPKNHPIVSIHAEYLQYLELLNQIEKTEDREQRRQLLKAMLRSLSIENIPLMVNLINLIAALDKKGVLQPVVTLKKIEGSEEEQKRADEIVRQQALKDAIVLMKSDTSIKEQIIQFEKAFKALLDFSRPYEVSFRSPAQIQTCRMARLLHTTGRFFQGNAAQATEYLLSTNIAWVFRPSTQGPNRLAISIRDIAKVGREAVSHNLFQVSEQGELICDNTDAGKETINQVITDLTQLQRLDDLLIDVLMPLLNTGITRIVAGYLMEIVGKKDQTEAEKKAEKAT